MALKRCITICLLTLSSCASKDNEYLEKASADLEQRQIAKAVYIQGNGCLACIQPELEQFVADSSTWIILHSKLDFLKGAFKPKVWVDWEGHFSPTTMDTSYFHVFIQHEKWLYRTSNTAKEVNQILKTHSFEFGTN